MDNPFKSPSIISFCPGVLGLERGLERVIGDLRVLAYCEIEAFICANLVAGMEAGVLAPAPIWTDAKTFPAEVFRGYVDWITGGYPCPPFSTAGKRKGEEDPRHLWPYLREHVRTIRPVGCFFENVAGHLSLGFDQVYKELSEMGYRVEAGIFTAEEVGAPHRRERLFILAISYPSGKQDRWLFKSWIQAHVGGNSAELENSDHSILWNNDRENTGRNRQQAVRQGDRAECAVWPGTASENGQLVNPSIIPQRKQTNETITFTKSGKTRTKLSIRCFEMVHTCVHHLERVLPQKFDQERWKGQNKGPIGSSDVWPARPDQQQLSWEAPRTVESGMGCTIDGYNFREDLLRALGNSVVEQTAQLAFRTLLAKHLKNLG